MALVDKLRDMINNFLNNGTAEDKVRVMAEEELDDALEQLRPELRKKIDTAVKGAMDRLNVDFVIDEKEIRQILTSKTVEIIEEDESEEIQGTIVERLCEQLKESKFLVKG